jgi:hypothetical protein
MRIHHKDGFSGIQVPPPAPFWQIVRIRVVKASIAYHRYFDSDSRKGAKKLLSRPLFGIPLKTHGERGFLGIFSLPGDPMDQDRIL